MTLAQSQGSDSRPIRVLWAVKRFDFWFELTESNVEYMVNLFRQSPQEEPKKRQGPQDEKKSPKRRRRLKRQRSDEGDNVEAEQRAQEAPLEQEP